MRFLIFVWVICLASCAGPSSSNRDTSVAMQSIVAFDPAGSVGEWAVVSAFPEEGCAPKWLTYSPRNGQGLMVEALCRQGPQKGSAVVSGPGRLTMTLAGKSQEIWVLWVDEGYRSMVLGTPSGRIGWVLNRTADMPADRMRAAREILDWNGYDLSKLQMVRR